MKHCLVVDDSRVIRTVARRILEDLRYSVDEAEDGLAALRACREKMPDLIFLDWNLPSMKGLDFIKSVRGQQDGGASRDPVLHHRKRSGRDRQRHGGRRQRICDEAVRRRPGARQAGRYRRPTLKECPWRPTTFSSWRACCAAAPACGSTLDKLRLDGKRRLAPVMRRFDFKDAGGADRANCGWAAKRWPRR